jgi:hypothetical protein
MLRALPALPAAALSVALAVAFALLGGCGSVAHRPDSDASQTLYVARRGWHIDVGFAVGELTPPLSTLIPQIPTARFVSLGFGDKHYLVARNESFPGMLGALWSGPGLILVSGLANSPQQAFGAEQMIEIRVTAAQAAAAAAFVWNSLLSRNGVAQVASQGPYEGSLYFDSTRRYSAFNTCNTWAAQVLKAADLPVRTGGVVFAGQLWSQVRRVARTQAASAGEELPAGEPARSQTR